MVATCEHNREKTGINSNWIFFLFVLEIRSLHGIVDGSATAAYFVGRFVQIKISKMYAVYNRTIQYVHFYEQIFFRHFGIKIVGCKIVRNETFGE